MCLRFSTFQVPKTFASLSFPREFPISLSVSARFPYFRKKRSHEDTSRIESFRHCFPQFRATSSTKRNDESRCFATFRRSSMSRGALNSRFMSCFVASRPRENELSQWTRDSQGEPRVVLSHDSTSRVPCTRAWTPPPLSLRRLALTFPLLETSSRPYRDEKILRRSLEKKISRYVNCRELFASVMFWNRECWKVQSEEKVHPPWWHLDIQIFGK